MLSASREAPCPEPATAAYPGEGCQARHPKRAPPAPLPAVRHGSFAPRAGWQPGQARKQSDSHRKATLKEASASPCVAFWGEGPQRPRPSRALRRQHSQLGACWTSAAEPGGLQSRAKRGEPSDGLSQHWLHSIQDHVLITKASSGLPAKSTGCLIYQAQTGFGVPVSSSPISLSF